LLANGQPTSRLGPRLAVEDGVEVGERESGDHAPVLAADSDPDLVLLDPGLEHGREVSRLRLALRLAAKQPRGLLYGASWVSRSGLPGGFSRCRGQGERVIYVPGGSGGLAKMGTARTRVMTPFSGNSDCAAAHVSATGSGAASRLGPLSLLRRRARPPP
jgi:hypothetical protein